VWDDPETTNERTNIDSTCEELLETPKTAGFCAKMLGGLYPVQPLRVEGLPLLFAFLVFLFYATYDVIVRVEIVPMISP